MPALLYIAPAKPATHSPALGESRAFSIGDAMVKLSVLVIAPDHPDLPNVLAEVAAIDQHHDAVCLTGVVRDVDIARAVEEGPYDVIWWASHGDYDGVQLTDGTLSIAGVGQYVRASGAELCVLNSCASENIGLAIVAGGAADMICTIADVGDPDAMRFGILLAAGLGQVGHDGVDFRAIYDQVAPTGGQYRYIAATGAGVNRSSQERFHDAIDRVYVMQADLRVIKAALVALAVSVALIFVIELVAWYRTSALITDLAVMQQTIYRERAP